MPCSRRPLGGRCAGDDVGKGRQSARLFGGVDLDGDPRARSRRGGGDPAKGEVFERARCSGGRFGRTGHTRGGRGFLRRGPVARADHGRTSSRQEDLCPSPHARTALPFGCYVRIFAKISGHGQYWHPAPWQSQPRLAPRLGPKNKVFIFFNDLTHHRLGPCFLPKMYDRCPNHARIRGPYAVIPRRERVHDRWSGRRNAGVGRRTEANLFLWRDLK